MDDERLAVALATWLFAACHGCPPEEVADVLADLCLALPAWGIAEELERRWIPLARVILAAVRAGGVEVPVETGRFGMLGG